MAMLEIIEGYHQGKTLEVRGPTTLGRAPNNTLCVYDNRVSRQHAVIRSAADGEGCVITDLGSGNGTFVNGQRLAPDVQHLLNDGDQIFLGTTRILFSSRQPSGTSIDVKKSANESSSSHFGDANLALKLDQGVEAPEIAVTLDAQVDMLQAQDGEEGLSTIKRLQAMVQVANEIGQVAKREVLLNRVMSRIFHIFPQADRAFVLLRHPSTGAMQPAVGRRRNAGGEETEEFPISNTIIKTVTDNRQSILSSDARKDFGEQQSIVDLSIRSLMCAPLICKEEILGIINVDTVTAGRRFAKDDLALLTGVASLAATALKNTALFDQVESEIQARSMLSRYMSPDVAKGIVDGTISAELGGKRVNGTVLFSDIVGFQEMADKMDPVQLVDKVNRCFKITTDIIARNGGTLNKFSGDAAMAFWNVMFKDAEPQLHALTAALQMQAADYYFNLNLDKQGEQPIYMGVGINTGDVAAGNIGGEQVEYTVMGAHVNLARSLMGLAGRWQVFVSEKTFAAVAGGCIAVALPPAKLPCSAQPVRAFSIRGVRSGEGKMVLNLPVRALDAKGNILGDGMVTGSLGQGQGMKLFFSTEAVIIARQQLTLHFDLPEYDGALAITGTVEDENRDTYYGQAAFSKSTIGSLTGEAGVFEFLRPGAAVESGKEWDAIKRKI